MFDLKETTNAILEVGIHCSDLRITLFDYEIVVSGDFSLDGTEWRHINIPVRPTNDDRRFLLGVVDGLSRTLGLREYLHNKFTVKIGLKTDLMAIRTDNKHPVIDAVLAELTPEQLDRLASKIEGGAL